MDFILAAIMPEVSSGLPFLDCSNVNSIKLLTGGAASCRRLPLRPILRAGLKISLALIPLPLSYLGAAYAAVNGQIKAEQHWSPAIK